MRRILIAVWNYFSKFDWLDKKNEPKTEQEWIDKQTGGW